MDDRSNDHRLLQAGEGREDGSGRYGAEVSARLRELSEWILARPAAADANARLHSDGVLAFDLGFIVFGALTLVAIHPVLPVPLESQMLARQTTTLLMLGLAASVACLRLTGSVALAAQVTLASVFGVVGASVALHGGTQSPVLGLVVMIPVVAGLLAGRSSAVFWSAAILVSLVALHRAEALGWIDIARLDRVTYVASLMANMTIACSAAIAAVMLHESLNAGLRKSLEVERRKLRHAAGHDPLTDLPNRRLFDELQDHALRRAERAKLKAALVVVDLDDFKPINDGFGHGSGDRVLKEIACRLRACTRATDAIARMGGDEFAILVERLDSEQGARILAGRLLDALSVDLELDSGTPVRVSASVGVALYPDDGETAEALHEAADSAMYAAKAAGGGCLRFFSDGSSPS